MIPIWVMFIASTLLVILAAVSLYLGSSSAHWPSTMGKVVVSKVVEIKTRGSFVGYHPCLVYEYVVEGRNHKSKTIGFFLGTLGNRWASDVLKGKEEGADVRVFYHPWIPSLSVVVPGIQQATPWLLLAFTGAVLCLSTGTVLFGENPRAFIDTVFGWVRALVT